MKKNRLFFAYIIGLVFLLNGCILDQPEPHGNRTKKGKQIYDAWNFSMNQTLQKFVNVAFHFNYWHDAAPAFQTAIEDSLFANYKIRLESDGSWGLYDGSVLTYKIVRNNQSLADAGAVWSVFYYANSAEEFLYYYPYNFSSFMGDSVEVTIENTTGRKWLVTMSENTNPNSSLNLEISTTSVPMPSGIDNEDMSFTGNGCFRFNEVIFEYEKDDADTPTYNFIEFDIESPLIVRDVTYSKILWNAGVLNLKAFNLNNDQIEVKVQFFAPDHQYNTIQITYKGITESYNDESEEDEWY